MTTEEQNIQDAIESGEIIEAIEPIYSELKEETRDYFVKAYFES